MPSYVKEFIFVNAFHLSAGNIHLIIMCFSILAVLGKEIINILNIKGT
jgi:hypothetical protein